jgi:hypothetical protein
MRRLMLNILKTGSVASILAGAITPAFGQAASQTVIALPPGTLHPGQYLSFVAAVQSSSAPVSSGTVTFSDGSTVVGSSPLNNSGLAGITVPGLSQGTHYITASYSGENGVAASATPATPLVIGSAAAPPSVTCTASPATINPGDSTTITGTATSPSNLPVTVSYTTTAGTITENGGTATLNSGGATGTIQVTCNAVDSQGQTASATAAVNINSGQGEQALPAFSFPDSIGVNIHLSSGNTKYFTDIQGVTQLLANLGVHHYRNDVDQWATPQIFANAETLAQAGIKGDWVIGNEMSAQNINNIIASAPNSVEAYEGPNEDDKDVGAPLKNLMSMLHDTVRSNPATSSFPIYNATITDINQIGTMGDLSAYADFGNMHDYYYPRFPETPSYGGSFYNCGGYGSMSFNVCVAKVNVPGKPVVSTETGYISGTQSDAVFGRYMARLLFEHLSMGVPRTYLYELLDEVNSPNYGLVHDDYSPKPAYTAIKNLISLFSDENFSAGKLDYSLTGQTDNVYHTLFQKKDGTWMMAIWLGVASANPVPGFETYSVPAQSVTLKSNTPVGAVTISTLDDNGNISTQPASSGNPVTIPVTDTVTIVSLAPAR